MFVISLTYTCFFNNIKGEKASNFYELNRFAGKIIKNQNRFIYIIYNIKQI